MTPNAHKWGWVRRMHAVGAVLLLCALLACQQSPTPDCGSDCVDDEVEPNNTFLSARSLAIPVRGTRSVAGAIDFADDIDVYDLGAVSVGDSVTVTAHTTGSNLRASIALYDDEGELIDEDTLTGELSRATPPSIAHRVRANSTHLFAAITHTGSRTTLGKYALDVDVARGGSAPTRQPQAVLLSFDGGTVEDSLFGTYDVGPFDAGNMHRYYDGETDTIKSVIRDTFEENYARFNIEIWSTDDPGFADSLAGRSFARVVFGGFNSFAFGAAQDVDLYNQVDNDAAIIFTESFEPDLFPIVPSAEGMGVAIGNVAAHEMGHLLGLNHVRDATAIMDEASPAYTLLADQTFKSAPLSPLIFPLGRQDSADLLSVILGLRAGTAKIAPNELLPLTDAWEEALMQSQSLLISNDPPRSKCLNCLHRAGLLGRGPLKDLAIHPPAQP